HPVASGRLNTYRARLALGRPPAPAPPVNTTPPLISGTTESGRTLSASTGTWTGGPTSYAFQWSRCDVTGVSCADVPGAGAQTYQLGPADVGFTIRVAVIATNAQGSATATSAPSSVVAAAPLQTLTFPGTVTK